MISIDDTPGDLIAAIVWGILLFAAFIILYGELSHAATLSISGSATGNGSQVMEIAGDNLTAWWNGTAWHIEGAF